MLPGRKVGLTTNAMARKVHVMDVATAGAFREGMDLTTSTAVSTVPSSMVVVSGVPLTEVRCIVEAAVLVISCCRVPKYGSALASR